MTRHWGFRVLGVGGWGMGFVGGFLAFRARSLNGAAAGERERALALEIPDVNDLPQLARQLPLHVGW